MACLWEVGGKDNCHHRRLGPSPEERRRCTAAHSGAGQGGSRRAGLKQLSPEDEDSAAGDRKPDKGKGGHEERQADRLPQELAALALGVAREVCGRLAEAAIQQLGAAVATPADTSLPSGGGGGIRSREVGSQRELGIARFSHGLAHRGC